MKKKLLIFGYTLDMGGAEKALTDTINYLVKDYDIDLYLLKKEGCLLDNVPDSVNIGVLRKNIFSYILFRYIPFFRKHKINKIANKKDYYAALGYMEGRSATWVADIKKPIKKLAWIHNDVSKFDIGISEKEIIDSYNKVDKVICVSKDAKDIFCDVYGIPTDKVEVIYNYIDENTILKKADEFKVDNKTFTIVNVAKMRDQKRHDRLIYAAKYLKELGYDFKMQLVGDGPNFDRIKELVNEYDLNDKVELLGLKANPYPYIKNADLFVLSSSHEGYGIVVKEALLLKTPVLSTQTTGPREILEDEKYGIIVPNDDYSIAHKLKEILDNKDMLSKYKKALNEYEGDNKKIVLQTLNLLK